MTASLPGWFGRAAAVAILLVLIASVWVGPVEAYLGALSAGAAEIDTRTATVQRYRALAEGGGAGEAAPAGPPLLLPDIPEAQAAALLQETVKAAADKAQVRIRGLQVLRAQNAAGAVRIGIRVSGSGEIADIGRLLYAVEAARPLLYPDNLQIRSGGIVSGSAPAPLDFQFDIAGFKAGTS